MSNEDEWNPGTPFEREMKKRLAVHEMIMGRIMDVQERQLDLILKDAETMELIDRKFGEVMRAFVAHRRDNHGAPIE